MSITSAAATNRLPPQSCDKSQHSKSSRRIFASLAEKIHLHRTPPRDLLFAPKRNFNQSPSVLGLRFQSRSRQRQGKPGEEELGIAGCGSRIFNRVRQSEIRNSKSAIHICLFV
jgi:hypothetical protein